jgi:hypothetical protein
MVYIFLNRAWSNYHQGDWYEAIADAGKFFESYALGEFYMAGNHYEQCLKLYPRVPVTSLVIASKIFKKVIDADRVHPISGKRIC